MCFYILINTLINSFQMEEEDPVETPPYVPNSMLESVVQYILHYRPDIVENFNFSRITKHSHLSFEFFKYYRNFDWDLKSLSRNKSLQWNQIANNTDFDWDYDYISNHKDLDFQFVLQNLDKPWNLDVISCHPNITTTDIDNNLTLPWNFNYIARKKNLTVEFILSHLDKFDLSFISSNDIITEDE